MSLETCDFTTAAPWMAPEASALAGWRWQYRMPRQHTAEKSCSTSATCGASSDDLHHINIDRRPLHHCSASASWCPKASAASQTVWWQTQSTGPALNEEDHLSVSRST